jgi:hypothetical protein
MVIGGDGHDLADVDHADLDSLGGDHDLARCDTRRCTVTGSAGGAGLAPPGVRRAGGAGHEQEPGNAWCAATVAEFAAIGIRGRAGRLKRHYFMLIFFLKWRLIGKPRGPRHKTTWNSIPEPETVTLMRFSRSHFRRLVSMTS